ncbi:MAG: hypothetical protein IJT91_06045, partial [Clostridia bacterium]|nr:hypothetical protein [Clostridia bacterium]
MVLTEGNSATNGGGILMGNYSTLNATMNTKINKCSAYSGGGIYVGAFAVLNVTAGTGDLRMTIDGCTAQFGGGMYIYGSTNNPGTDDGVVNFAGGKFTGNSGVNGNDIYQNGKFNLSANAVFGDYSNGVNVYLPSLNTADNTRVRVITDNGYTGSSVITIELGNDTNTYEYNGRNYVEGNSVTSEKFSKYTVINVKAGLECAYTASDALIGKPVLELILIPNVSLVITKTVTDSIRDDQTFIFHVKGTPGTPTANIDLTVTINKQGSVTVSNLPIGEYTVTEDRNWSYRYYVLSDASITKTVDVDGVTFDFLNAYIEQWLTYDCCAWNQWDEAGYTVTRKH